MNFELLNESEKREKPVSIAVLAQGEGVPTRLTG